MVKNEKDIKKFVLQNLFAFLGVLVVILNLWLASKLAPLAEGVSGLTIRVSANEKRFDLYADTLQGIDLKVTQLIKDVGKLEGACYR